jgi:hypothetical protein
MRFKIKMMEAKKKLTSGLVGMMELSHWRLELLLERKHS